MEYRQLGRTGTRVSQLCLGTMNFGDVTDQSAATQIVDEAIDAGINFIDTADVYTRGASEEMVGKALQKNGKRDDIVLATKAVAAMGDGQNDRGASRFHLSRAVEDSLKRLQTDRIDLFYLHVVDITTPMDEIFGQLDILVKQGKILYVGTSKWPVPLIMDGLAMHEKYDYPRIVAEQPPYHLCDRGIEMELVWTCMRHGIGLVTWGPLAYGILSGMYRKGQPIPEGHRWSGADLESNKRFTPDALELVEKLIPIAEAKGIDLPALSHAWLQQRPGITCPIVGPRTITHLHAALKTTEISFTQEELDAIDAAIAPGTWVSDFYFGNTYAHMVRSINHPENPTGYY
jgi:aryl-alcohol dehydrogenase-like predicted oxidoreductase